MLTIRTVGGDFSPSLPRREIVSRDPAMLALRSVVERVADADVNVLLLGETGVGKDVMASMVHASSGRCDRPFVGINCASLPEMLLESELFGHERGAFTGAVTSKPGLLETADGGTVFLDEVGDLPLVLQAKLLRVIESREVMRVGALRARRIDVRYVSATNRELARAVAEGRFRQDLYYRLNCVTLTVPPLRERPSDIAPLAEYFLRSACERFGYADRAFSAAAQAALGAHGWPGNVRELRNVVERAVLLAPGVSIEPEHLGLVAAVVPAADHRPRVDEPVSAARPERDRIADALVACAGNQSRAADLLGISRRTLVRRIASLRLPRPRRPFA
ncbi:MAG TPA: sigma-54 dependent transcriptional regulator [Polyangia bacterium]|nr:sigma-54 dependent transcriptional regulator [Polyangia bacterium]